MVKTAPMHVFDDRREEERYRIYERRRNGSLDLVATTDSKEGIGVALVTLHDEGEFTPESNIGILDGLDHRWLVSPFVQGGRP